VFVRRSLECANPQRFYSSSNHIQGFEELMKRRFFYAPSFSIYGSLSGLYDLGPSSTVIKWKLLESWKDKFIYQSENVIPTESSSILSEKVLQASGHLQKFQDMVIRDTLGQCYRADHLLMEHLESLKLPESEIASIKHQMGDFTPEEMKAKMLQYGLTHHPETKTELTETFNFNLMFQTKVGAEGKHTGFFRPEIAQGIFVNFQRLFEQSGGKLPFGAASIGSAYRNEASPRQGLLRTREFTLAEIEYFLHPDDISHSQFTNITSKSLPILSACQQKSENPETIQWISAEQLNELVHNETLVYYCTQAYEFLLQSGIQPNTIRFRQHLSNEMAHYAKSCWDVEIFSQQYGWIECIGIAHRGSYDLSQHSKCSGQPRLLQVFQPFPDGPKMEQKVSVRPVQPKFGKHFRERGPAVLQYLNNLCDEEFAALYSFYQDPQSSVFRVNVPDFSVDLPKELVEFHFEETQVSGSNITPIVIEPSFGINRILYCILEQSFRVRENDFARTFLSLPLHLVPTSCVILPLFTGAEFKAAAHSIAQLLRKEKIDFKIDDAGQSIGKRYARTDELGIPFAITVDHQTVEEIKSGSGTVTLRERDSTTQTRLPIQNLPQKLRELFTAPPTLTKE
jgi:glycyl-tRNA synthetase